MYRQRLFFRVPSANRVAGSVSWSSKLKIREAASEFIKEDPAVAAGLFTAELHPFSLALARKNSE
jgi:hypothetical protein